MMARFSASSAKVAPANRRSYAASTCWKTDVRKSHHRRQRIDGDERQPVAEGTQEHRHDFQHFNLLSSRTVYDNIAFPLELAGASKDVIKSKVQSLLELVDLTEREFNYPSQLSGGQKQRVGIARALASDPKILLCDEATSALDPQTTKSILSLLKDINKRLGITVILITHEMAVVKEICDRVAVIEGGVIKEQGRVIDIFTNPTSDTMKEFVKSVINMELPQGIRNMGLTDQPSPDSHMLVRLRFKGNVTNDPLVVHVARKFNIDVSVLYGNIDYIQNVPFGYLIVVIMGDMEIRRKPIRTSNRSLLKVRY